LKIANNQGLLPQSMLPQKATHESQNAFSKLLNENLSAPKAKGIERQDEIGEILRRSRGRDDYADEFMKSYMNSIGGPLMDYTDPQAVRFTYSGELVTEEAMRYYNEMQQIAKQGYQRIYSEGKAQGRASEQVFEEFLDFTAALPARYKQMASIWF